jgi:hypothetical protein
MSRQYRNKGLRGTYSLNVLHMALDEVKRGCILRDVAERYNIPKSTLGKYRNTNLDEVRVGAGRKTTLKKEDEDALAKYLFKSGKYGYGLTKQEIFKFVEEFGQLKDIQWNGNDKYAPGREWYAGFMKKHPELSVRKGESMSAQRLRGADLFTIQEWYRKLQVALKKEKITNGHYIFNCDETGFNHDPKDVKLIAPKGQKRVSKNISGSGKKILPFWLVVMRVG